MMIGIFFVCLVFLNGFFFVELCDKFFGEYFGIVLLVIVIGNNNFR